jgi:hypothetical protein
MKCAGCEKEFDPWAVPLTRRAAKNTLVCPNCSHAVDTGKTLKSTIPKGKRKRKE